MVNDPVIEYQVGYVKNTPENRQRLARKWLENWVITRAGRPHSKATTKKKAVKKGRKLAKDDRPARFLVYNKDNTKLTEEMMYL